jgi:hypothetical protein
VKKRGQSEGGVPGVWVWDSDLARKLKVSIKMGRFDGLGRRKN